MSFYDLLAFLGAIMLSIGVGLIYVPAGVITAGVMLIVIGLVGSYARAHAGGKW